MSKMSSHTAAAGRAESHFLCNCAGMHSLCLCWQYRTAPKSMRFCGAWTHRQPHAIHDCLKAKIIERWMWISAEKQTVCVQHRDLGHTQRVGPCLLDGATAAATASNLDCWEPTSLENLFTYAGAAQPIKERSAVDYMVYDTPVAGCYSVPPPTSYRPGPRSAQYCVHFFGFCRGLVGHPSGHIITEHYEQ